MSSFKNVTEDDLQVSVDGITVQAPAGEVFTIADEYDYQFADQPAFESAKTPKPPKAEIVSDATEEKN